MAKIVSPLEIYPHLPDDCERLFQASKMAVAAQLAGRKLKMKDIRDVYEKLPPGFMQKYEKLEELLKPAIAEIEIGTGDNKIIIGGDDVMFRHTLSFYNKPPIAVDVWDTMTDAQLKSRLKKITEFRKFYVGDFLCLDMVAVRSASGNPETFGKCVKKVIKNCSLPLILCTKDPKIMRSGLESAAGKNPLMYACDTANREEMTKLAIEFDVPIVVCGGGDLDTLKTMAATLQNDGVEKIVLDPGMPAWGADLKKAFQNFIKIRKAGMDGVKDLAFPMIALPIAARTGKAAASSAEAGNTAASSAEAGNTAASSAEAGNTAASSAEAGNTAASNAAASNAAASSAEAGSAVASNAEAGKAAASSAEAGKAAASSAEASSAEAGNAKAGSAEAGNAKAGRPKEKLPPEIIADYHETMAASALTIRYADIMIIHGLEPHELLPLVHVTDTIYTDPRTPSTVEPKLYRIGHPGPASPVLFTTNFALTYYTVESDLVSAGFNGFLLAADTGGLGVEAAVAGGQLTAAAVKKDFEEAAFDIKTETEHRTLILPGLAARLQNDIEKIMEISTMTGPMDSGRLGKWLEENWPPKKDKDKKT